MSFDTRRVGVTGPSARIGGSSDYHIDTKFSQSLPLRQRVEAFTSVARRYADEGRNVEFSNQGVAGMVFDPNAPYEQRQSIYQQAASAHAPRQGFDSLDYYVPLQGHDRWHSSAEGAPIYVPMQQGQSLYRGQGGGYGRFADVSSAGGQVLFRSGHGDTGAPVGEDPKPTGPRQTSYPVAGDPIYQPGATVAQAPQEPEVKPETTPLQTNQATIFRGPQLGQAQASAPADKPETRERKNKASSLAQKFKNTMADQLALSVVQDYLA